MVMDTNPWQELTAIVDKSGPRYAEAYGCCPICRRGAHIVSSPAPPLWWCQCWTCDTRWVSRVQNFLRRSGADPEPALDEDPEMADLQAELRYNEMCALASCHQLDPVSVSPTAEGVFSMKPTVTQSSFLVDPWAGEPISVKNLPDDPKIPPPHWHQLNLATRERVTCVCLEGDPPGVDLGSLGSWKRLRARFWTADQQGEPGLKDALAPYYERDPNERAKWIAAEHEISNAPFTCGPELLAAVARKLWRAGDLLDVLRGRRADLDKQIAMIEQHRLALR